MKRFFILLSLSILLLTGCGGQVFHRVERGETLYSIGWVYGYDYRQIAQWNNIQPPYALSPGQRLRVAPPAGQSALPLQEYRESLQNGKEAGTGDARKSPAPVVNATDKPTKVVEKSRNLHDTTAEPEKHDAQSVITAAKTAVKKLFNQSGLSVKRQPAAGGVAHWQWPTKSRRVLYSFSADNPLRQGLDIAGEVGNPVLAAAAGRVVYAGSGLVRYGRLIIIKHNEKYLSAYAHNQKLQVKEGDEVKAGQQIAEMGRSGNLGGQFKNNQRAKLHFEIRRNGKPVDPKRFLPR